MEERNGRLRVSDMTFGFQSWELRSVRSCWEVQLEGGRRVGWGSSHQVPRFAF